jgi:Protein of unknown function (DUF3489)
MIKTTADLPGVTQRLKKNAAQAAYRARKKANADKPAAPKTKAAVPARARKAKVETLAQHRPGRKVKGEATASAPKPARKARAPKAATAKAGESRKDLVLRLLTRASGASVAEIMEATGWQPHTTRAFISATLGKKLGHKIESEKVDGRGRVYRIATEAEAESEAA